MKMYGKEAAFIDTVVEELQRGEQVMVVAKTQGEAERILRAVGKRVAAEELKRLTMSSPRNPALAGPHSNSQAEEK
jgi:hypothetical protein